MGIWGGENAVQNATHTDSVKAGRAAAAGRHRAAQAAGRGRRIIGGLKPGKTPKPRKF